MKVRRSHHRRAGRLVSRSCSPPAQATEPVSVHSRPHVSTLGGRAPEPAVPAVAEGAAHPLQEVDHGLGVEPAEPADADGDLLGHLPVGVQSSRADRRPERHRQLPAVLPVRPAAVQLLLDLGRRVDGQRAGRLRADQEGPVPSRAPRVLGGDRPVRHDADRVPRALGGAPHRRQHGAAVDPGAAVGAAAAGALHHRRGADARRPPTCSSTTSTTCGASSPSSSSTPRRSSTTPTNPKIPKTLRMLATARPDRQLHHRGAQRDVRPDDAVVAQLRGDDHLRGCVVRRSACFVFNKLSPRFAEEM